MTTPRMILMLKRASSADRWRKNLAQNMAIRAVARHNKVTEKAGVPRAGANPKPHHNKQIVQKKMDLPKTWVLTWKRLKTSDEKEMKYTSGVNQTAPCDTQLLKTTFEDGPCDQEEINKRKNEKNHSD